MLNRAAVILYVKPSMLEWINATYDHVDMPAVDSVIANADTTVYLVDEDAAEDKADYAFWLKKNWKWMFEQQLGSWYTDTSMWPQDLSQKMFEAWFDIQIHSVVTDTVDQLMVDDGH